MPVSLAEAPDPFEPKAYAALAPVLPAGALVWVSSSMPVRDVESYFPATDKAIRFLANRGANGIDGVMSSAAGAALATGGPTFLLPATWHCCTTSAACWRPGAPGRTSTGLREQRRWRDLRLPAAAGAADRPYEEHVATPAAWTWRRSPSWPASSTRLAATPAEIHAAATGPGLIEVRTDRAANVRLHRELFERVGAAQMA